MFRVKRDPICKSRLYDQNSFYPAFIDDIKQAKTQVIIESPYITTKRIDAFIPIFEKLILKGVQIVINTKPLDEHNSILRSQAASAIAELQDLGVLVLLTVGHHRKLAVIDKHIVWEGSLNILSQNDSCELVWKMISEYEANRLFDYLDYKTVINSLY